MSCTSPSWARWRRTTDGDRQASTMKTPFCRTSPPWWSPGGCEGRLCGGTGPHGLLSRGRRTARRPRHAGGRPRAGRHEGTAVVTHRATGRCPRARRSAAISTGRAAFDHMQQHSGEHIVSGLLCSASTTATTWASHLGADTVTIDYNADISWEQVQDIERRVNRYIWENPTQSQYLYPPRRSWPPCPAAKSPGGLCAPHGFPGAPVCLLRHPCDRQRQ